MTEKARESMRVVVLAGGISDEREISLNSGKNVCAALTEAGFGTVEMLDPAAGDFIDRLRGGAYDVAFPALHGKGGEDGQIQSVLEFCGVPYAGSGCYRERLRGGQGRLEGAVSACGDSRRA